MMKKQHAIEALPQGYKEIYTIDLQKDKKAAIFVNILAIIVMIVMVVAANPFSAVFESVEDIGITADLSRMLVLVVGMIAYIILHELVHGVTMKLFGTKKVKYGFTGLYAYAGSTDYYDKFSYLTIALAPVVLWGIVLVVLNVVLDASWFWYIYIIQIINVSGAAGDAFVTVKFSRMPKDIYVQDYGVGMKVYSQQS